MKAKYLLMGFLILSIVLLLIIKLSMRSSVKEKEDIQVYTPRQNTPIPVMDEKYYYDFDDAKSNK